MTLAPLSVAISLSLVARCRSSLLRRSRMCGRRRRRCFGARLRHQGRDPHLNALSHLQLDPFLQVGGIQGGGRLDKGPGVRGLVRQWAHPCTGIPLSPATRTAATAPGAGSPRPLPHPGLCSDLSRPWPREVAGLRGLRPDAVPERCRQGRPALPLRPQ
ncbi:hypothetical protein V8C86DRAFT_2589421 [Haematococcus lacustris]